MMLGSASLHKGEGGSGIYADIVVKEVVHASSKVAENMAECDTKLDVALERTENDQTCQVIRCKRSKVKMT